MNLDWSMIRKLEGVGWKFLRLNNSLLAYHNDFANKPIHNNSDLIKLLSDYEEDA